MDLLLVERSEAGELWQQLAGGRLHIPETFFVFVNLLNPMTAHNARLVGSFTSSAWTSAVEDEAFREKHLSGNVDYLPFIPNPSSDQKFLSSYYAGATSDYKYK